MSELRTIAELVALADGNPAALAMLRAARTLIDRALETAGTVIEMPALPAPQRDDAPRQQRAGKSNGGGRPVAAKPSRQPHAARMPATKNADLKAAANGVRIDGCEISFNGKSITVTPREAQVAAQLARVMPNLLDHKRIGAAVWPECGAESRAQMASTLTRSLGESVEAIGLKVTRVRGIGAALLEV
jgi:DNA-binding response OmpR family regulator